jgi:hypothetical protein
VVVLPALLAVLGLPALLGLRLPLLIRNEQVSLTSARRHGQARPTGGVFFCVALRVHRGEHAVAMSRDTHESRLHIDYT